MIYGYYLNENIFCNAIFTWHYRLLRPTLVQSIGHRRRDLAQITCNSDSFLRWVLCRAGIDIRLTVLLTSFSRSNLCQSDLVPLFLDKDNPPERVLTIKYLNILYLQFNLQWISWNIFLVVPSREVANRPAEWHMDYYLDRSKAAVQWQPATVMCIVRWSTTKRRHSRPNWTIHSLQWD